MISVEAPDGGITETDYGVLGRVTATRDALDRETSYTYDADGNLTAVEAPDGGVTTTEYDAAGRVVAVEDPLGRRTENTYDAYGRLIGVEHPDATITEYGYDILNRQVSVTVADGGETVTAYTDAGRVATVTDPLSNVTSYGYDLAGRLETITDALSHVTTYGYDIDGRMISVTTPEGDVTSYGLDEMGRAVLVTDPAGVETAYTYTLRGELATSQLGADGIVEYSYLLDGSLDEVADALGSITAHSYDDAGRLVARTDAALEVETWTYNLAGELVTATDRLDRDTDYTYDLNGRLASVTDPTARSAAYVYDLAGQLESVTYGDSSEVVYTYDLMGRRASMTDSLLVTSYDYDPVGRLVEVANAIGTTHYSWDLVGNRTSIALPYDSVSDNYGFEYFYDDANRLVEAHGGTAYELANNEYDDVDYVLDDDGRPIETWHDGVLHRTLSFSDGQLVGRDDDGGATSYSYDTQGRIDALTGDYTDSYTYDAAGQLTAAVKDSVSYTYTYGDRGEITSIDDPLGYRQYTHNAALELVSISDGITTTGEFDYDDAGRLTSWWSDYTGYDWTHTYNAAGQLTNTTLGGHSWGDTVDDDYYYNGDGQLIGINSFVNDYDNTYLWDNTLTIPQTIYANGGSGEQYNLYGYEHEHTQHTNLWTNPRDPHGNSLENLTGDPNDAYSPYGFTDTPTGSHDAYFDIKLAGTSHHGEQHNLTGIHLRNRTLQPEHATFTTKDPLPGIPGTTTYTNPYHYTNNDPINHTDPLGLSATDATFNGSGTGLGSVPLYGTTVGGVWIPPIPAVPWFRVGNGLGGFWVGVGTAVVGSPTLPIWLTIGGVGLLGVGILSLGGEPSDVDVRPNEIPTGTTTTIPLTPRPPLDEPGPRTDTDGPPNGTTTTTIPPASCSDDSEGEDVTPEATNEHHSDPMYLGGDPDQPLTTMPRSEHVDLHRTMQQFMRQQTNADGDHMAHSCVNSGDRIQEIFSRPERLDALARFYRGLGARFASAARDFFSQHPTL